MNWLAFTETVVTLFVIVDPLGTVPVFVALTAERTPGQRRWRPRSLSPWRVC
jgi:multiple antibiotic resistance protein